MGIHLQMVATLTCIISAACFLSGCVMRRCTNCSTPKKRDAPASTKCETPEESRAHKERKNGASLPGDRAERVENITQQHERVDRAFEFYFTITLAILGGMSSLIASRKSETVAMVNARMRAAGWLQRIAGIACSVMIFLHLTSKMNRWARRFSWWEPLVWMECWCINILMVIAVS